MADDAPSPAPAMTEEELHTEAELRLRDIGQLLGVLPQDKDELLRLLDDAETWLAWLNQKKARSMLDALSPTKAVLISRDLLDHPDPDAKLAVTSCLTEVTRLTAPDAPYGDDVMKEVFQRMVGTFTDLGDINSPAYERRVSILDCVARVKSCTLMLDLEMDPLMPDIFHHIFKAASKNHSKNVTECMEDILKVVIEEIDDVHVELASCLLQNLTKEAKETLPAPFGLAERVVYLCKDRLKPVFAQLMMDDPLDNYSNVVRLICQNTSNVVADNNPDAFGINMAGEGEIFERSVSEESPQETSKVEDVYWPRQDDTRLGITPTIAVSNGGVLGDNNKFPDGSVPSEPKPEVLILSGDERVEIEQLISGHKEVSEPFTSETEKPSDVNSKKSEKLDSSTGSERTEHSKAVKDNGSHVAAEELSLETDHGYNKQLTEPGKEAADTTPAVIKKRGRPPAAKSQGKKPSKVVKDNGSHVAAEELSLETDHGYNKQLTEPGTGAADTTPAVIEKQGRPPAAKSQGKKPSKVVKDNGSDVAAEELSLETDHGYNKQLTEPGKETADTTPAVIKKRGRPPAAKSQGKNPSKVVKDNGSHVAAEELSLETDHGYNKQLIEPGKEAADTTPAVIKKRGRPPAAKSQGKKPAIKKQGSALKSGKVYLDSDSGRRITRQQSKEDAKSSSTETACTRLTGAASLRMDSLKPAKDVSDKDADEDTSLKEMAPETEDQQEDGGVSKRKRLQEAEEAPQNKMLDENLVGSRIKVWWPEDKMFYNGVVESFDASSEKHKVAYEDGDVEMLVLKNEEWDFTDEDQDRDPDAASDMPRGGRGKGSSGLQMEGVKTGTPLSGSNGGNPPKKRGRPKGARSSNNVSDTDSPAGSSRPKRKCAEKGTQETHNRGRRITRPIGKAKDDVVKTSNKDEAGSTKSAEVSNDKAGSEDNNSHDDTKSSEADDGPLEEKAPAEVSTGHKRGRKSLN